MNLPRLLRAATAALPADDANDPRYRPLTPKPADAAAAEIARARAEQRWCPDDLTRLNTTTNTTGPWRCPWCDRVVRSDQALREDA